MKKIDQTKLVAEAATVKAYDEQFPSSDYDKGTFSFSADESKEMFPLNVIMECGKNAQVTVNMLFTRYLQRVGRKLSVDNVIYYNMETQRFYVYSPRKW